MQIVEGWTDIWHVYLGDWRDERTMRKIKLTGFDGKQARGVVNGVVVDVPFRNLFCDKSGNRFKKSELIKLCNS